MTKRRSKKNGMANAVGLVAIKVLLDRKCTSEQHTLKGRELAEAIRAEWSDPTVALAAQNGTIESHLSVAASGIFKGKLVCRGPHGGYYYNEERDENSSTQKDSIETCDSLSHNSASLSTGPARSTGFDYVASTPAIRDDQIIKREAYLYPIVIAYMQSVLNFEIAVDISNRRLNGKNENSDVLAASYFNTFGRVEIVTALVEVKASVAGFFDALDAARKQREHTHQAWIAWRDPESTVSSMRAEMIRRAENIGLIEIRLNDEELKAFVKNKKPLSEVLSKISIVNYPASNTPQLTSIERLLEAGNLKLGLVKKDGTLNAKE